MATAARKRHKKGSADRASERSLGFIPLLIMVFVYLICTVFSDAIGPITSAPGMFRLNVNHPYRGCIMPPPSA